MQAFCCAGSLLVHKVVAYKIVHITFLFRRLRRGQVCENVTVLCTWAQVGFWVHRGNFRTAASPFHWTRHTQHGVRTAPAPRNVWVQTALGLVPFQKILQGRHLKDNTYSPDQIVWITLPTCFQAERRSTAVKIKRTGAVPAYSGRHRASFSEVFCQQFVPSLSAQITTIRKEPFECYPKLILHGWCRHQKTQFSVTKESQ